MGLYEISQAKILAFFVNIVIQFLGHCLLLNRASLPWRGTKPITHKETCPGFFNIAGATNKEHRLASLPRCEADKATIYGT